MTLLAHQTDVRFPSIAKGEARVHRVPLVPATAENLAGFGEIIPDFASAKVKMTPWPLKGWRPMSPGVNGNEAGEVEGAFSMWAEGGLLFGRNEAVKRAYIIGWYDDPATARRDAEPASRDRSSYVVQHERGACPAVGERYVLGGETGLTHRAPDLRPHTRCSSRVRAHEDAAGVKRPRTT